MSRVNIGGMQITYHDGALSDATRKIQKYKNAKIPKNTNGPCKQWNARCRLQTVMVHHLMRQTMFNVLPFSDQM